MGRGQILVSASAAQRCERAAAFLRALAPDSPCLVLSPSLAAGTALLNDALSPGALRFAWFKRTPLMLAHELSVRELSRRKLTPVHGAGVEALCTRVAHELARADALVRYHAVADRPGFVRALSSTVGELRMAGVAPEALAQHDQDLSRLLAAYERELGEAGLVDQAGVYRAAMAALAEAPPLPAGVPLLVLDVDLWHAYESDFLAALVQRAPSFAITVLQGDERTREELARVLPTCPVEQSDISLHTDLDLLRTRLFATSMEGQPVVERGRVELLSSPGEGREAVEVVRKVLAFAREGTRFDRMAVVLRATRTYRAVIEEAFARAEVPAHFADGVERPHPEGRAFLALLECAREQLSARAFAEYLSLGVMVRAGEDEADDKPALPAPRRWEKLLVDAAVMHGRERWERRLRGLAEALAREVDLLEADDPRRGSLSRDVEQLAALRAFAMPILDALAALPTSGTWGEWITRLTALAQLALGAPESVLDVLSELWPLSPLGPVSLRDVMRVLERRITTRLVRSEGPAVGKVLVGSMDDVRGLHFEVVFVLGLSEKLFPPRITEDPLLPDPVRRNVSAQLPCMDDRARRERAYLHGAVSAANARVVLSFPRFDTVHARPRVPSFYGLEVLRAVDNVLPAFDELSRRAQPGAAARMGFPAPGEPAQAIDDAEYDLAVLDQLLRAPPEAQRGAAGYLLSANAHLARALRFRARRWMLGKFTPADGFVLSPDTSREALARYSVKARPYSPTALAAFSACPYRFFLHAIMRVSARETVSAQDELDARQRGVFFHAVQRRALTSLRDRKLLPLSSAAMAEARALLADAFAVESEQARETFAPAIEGVFRDALRAAQRDLEEWLVRLSEERAFTPAYFELGFGVGAREDLDPESRGEPVTLHNGMRFAGVIDLVERGLDPEGKPLLRATDHKTGSVPERLGNVVSGGRVLQPLLYALALEQLFPAEKVQGGRLYYCTAEAGFKSHPVLLHEHSRIVARELAESIEKMIGQGFLPAAPGLKECEYCPYQSVCGPYEELRVSKGKRNDFARLEPLHHVRNLP